MNKQQFRAYGIAIIIVVVIFIVIGTTHTFGYRLTLRGFVKASTLEILVEKAGSKVFLNNNREAITDKDDEIVSIKNITPGALEILISKDGYWPWAKPIEIGRDETKRITAFAVRSDVQGIIIPPEDPEYIPLSERIASSTIPTKDNPVRSADEKSIAWIEGTNIVIQWIGTAEDAPYYLCEEKTENSCSPVEIFGGTETIRGLDFYKNRNDILLFSASNGIFAIEANKEGIQNFQPIYKGVALGVAFFVDRIDNVLYARDGELLLIINL